MHSTGYSIVFLSLDFENVLINEEPVSRVFGRENLCFNRDLPSSLILLYWSGTLTYSRSKVHDVMISYVEGRISLEECEPEINGVLI